MNLRLAVLLIMGWGFILSTGCSKDDPGGTDNCTLSDSALAGNYKITAATYQLDAQSQAEDYYAIMDSCDREVVYQFFSSGEYYELVPAECGDSYYGLWSLAGSNLRISGIDSLNVRQYPITHFSCNSFTTRDVKSLGDIFTFTYTRQ